MLKDGKDYVLESSEEAVNLHLDMWRDMQKDLGDIPSPDARVNYKAEWLTQKGYKNVNNNCFLCEFARYQWSKSLRHICSDCNFCPINWSALSNYGIWCYSRYIHGKGNIYLTAPISEILALPVKGDDACE